MQVEEMFFIEKELMSTFFEDQFRGKFSTFQKSGNIKIFSVRNLSNEFNVKFSSNLSF